MEQVLVKDDKGKENGTASYDFDGVFQESTSI